MANSSSEGDPGALPSESSDSSSSDSGSGNCDDAALSCALNVEKAPPFPVLRRLDGGIKASGSCEPCVSMLGLDERFGVVIVSSTMSSSDSSDERGDSASEAAMVIMEMIESPVDLSRARDEIIRLGSRMALQAVVKSQLRQRIRAVPGKCLHCLHLLYLSVHVYRISSNCKGTSRYWTSCVFSILSKLHGIISPSERESSQTCSSAS